MLDYFLVVIIIIAVFVSGFVAYRIPLIGIVAVLLSFLMLIPVAINPTVIIGTGFNSTTGQSYLITHEATELRTFTVFSIVICLIGTIAGLEKNLYD